MVVPENKRMIQPNPKIIHRNLGLLYIFLEWVPSPWSYITLELAAVAAVTLADRCLDVGKTRSVAQEAT